MSIRRTKVHATSAGVQNLNQSPEHEAATLLTPKLKVEAVEGHAREYSNIDAERVLGDRVSDTEHWEGSQRHLARGRLRLRPPVITRPPRACSRRRR